MSDSGDLGPHQIHDSITDALEWARLNELEPQLLLCDQQTAHKLGLFVTTGDNLAVNVEQTGIYGLEVHVDKRFSCPRVVCSLNSCREIE